MLEFVINDKNYNLGLIQDPIMILKIDEIYYSLIKK